MKPDNIKKFEILNEKKTLNLETVVRKRKNTCRAAVGVIFILFLSFLTVFLSLTDALAWGPSSPTGGKWLAGSPRTFTFTAESSGLYAYNTVGFYIENNGASALSGTSSSVSKSFTLTKDSPTDKSRWKVRFYKWDGVDQYGNRYGEGWTGWSSWAYFGVDSAAPGVPTRVSPANDDYVKCTAASPLTVDWTDSTDAMSGLQKYRLEISGVATQYPVASQQSFTSMTEGWHNWYVYARDNCYGNAVNTSTKWESAATTGTWRFYVDNTAPVKGSKNKPNYLATSGSTVPNGIDVAVNPNAPIPEAGGAGNIDTPKTNGIVTSDGKLMFTWTAATDSGSGIKEYNFMVTCPGIGTINKTTGNLYYNLGAGDGVFASLPNGSYSWNITAYDKALNSTVYDSNYKVVVDRTYPTVGGKTKPVAGFATNNPSIEFKWTPSTDNDKIRKYELYIASVTGSYLAKVECGELATGVIQNITLAPFNYTEGHYKWNLRAYDRAYNYRWYSGDLDFYYDKTKPEPGTKVKPHCRFFADGQIDMFCSSSKNVYFEWTEAEDLPAAIASGVARYELYIDNILKYSGTSTSTTVTDIAQGLHTWNIKVFDRAGNFQFYNPDQDDWLFKVDLTNPTAGAKIKPVQNFKTKDTFVNFEWTNSNDVGAGASGVDRIDLLKVSGPVDFSTSKVVIRAPEDAGSNDWSVTAFGAGSITKTGLAEGEYTWNVRAYDRSGRSSLYDGGAAWKFTVDLTPPDEGNKVSPVDGYISKENKVKFQWTAATDNYSVTSAIKYNLRINKGVGTTLAYQKNNVTSPFTNDIALPDGDYNWNIIAVDEAGNERYYGAAWKLKIDTTPPVPGEMWAIESFEKPNANGVDITTGSPTFQWTPATDPNPPGGLASGINKYRLIIEIPRNVIKYDTGYVIPNAAGKIVYTASGLNLPIDGPYYWSVWVSDIAGNTVKYLQHWNFYVEAEFDPGVISYEFLISRENAKISGAPALYQPSPAYEVLVSGKPPKTTATQYTPLTDIVPSPPDPANNKYGTTFYWSIRNSDDTGLWGKYEDYAVNIVTLYSGELVKPVDKSYSPIKPKFEWTHAMPQEVRRRYRIVVFKNAWPATDPLTTPLNRVIFDYSSPASPDGSNLELEYQSTVELADGKYFWSVYATDDMGKENKYAQTWSFEIARKPFVTMASQNLKWYAGYPNGIFVDAFGANGFKTLGTCEVTFYKSASGSEADKIRTLTLFNGARPADITRHDGDSADRITACPKLYSSSSFVITDNAFPSDKRYLFNVAANYNFIDKYGAANKIYAKARVYFYDQNNPGYMGIYTDYPATGTMMIGEVENKVKLRNYNTAATEDTESIFFAYGAKDSKRNYSFLTPVKSKPPETLQYVSTEDGSDDVRSLFFNGMAYFESPHAALSGSLGAVDSYKLKNAAGEQFVWRITNLPDSYDTNMRLKLFKNADYIPQNTFDFMKILAEFSGTTPVSVNVTTANWFNAANQSEVENSWSEDPAQFDYLDRGEDSANDNTLTKYETWVYSTSGDSIALTYAADMASQIFLNGEVLSDQYNMYNQDESQHRQSVQVPLSMSMLTGWNHLVIYVLHQKKSAGNKLNGLCYKFEGYSRSEAFKGAASYKLWHAFPVPQPNTNDFQNNGRGTSIVVYKQIKESGTFKDVMASKIEGAPAIFSNHKGIFHADKSALDKIVVSKPLEGGDHKMSLGIVSNEVFNGLEPRFSMAEYGDYGYIKMHINNTPEVPDDVNRINKNSPVLVCNEPYKDVESVATLKPFLTVKEDAILDEDNPSQSFGFHHSMYYSDYMPGYPGSTSIRTDEIRYVYAVDESSIAENFYDITWAAIKYKKPAVFTEVFSDYFLSSHTVETAFTQAVDEAHNINGEIGPIFHYRVWAFDEHGELQMIASPERRFCIDLSPPVVADIQVFYDRENVRLDGDISPFVEKDNTGYGTNSIALIGHTLTLWAFCTDEITADPRNFKDGKFFIRRSDSPSDDWVEVKATCEVNSEILSGDIDFNCNRVPQKHPNGYYWYGYYTIPCNSDLTYYDVDFQISDALGNRTKKLSESTNPLYAQLTKKQFKVGTICLNEIEVPETLSTKTLKITWNSFADGRETNSVTNYLVTLGEIMPADPVKRKIVSGSLNSCDWDLREDQEGKLPVFITPIEEVKVKGSNYDIRNAYSFERRTGPLYDVAYIDGWNENVPSGGYFSEDARKVLDGMFSWANFMDMSSLIGEYELHKDYNIGENIKVAFGLWIKKETLSSRTKLQAICYNREDNVINPNASGVTFETDFDGVDSQAWIHYYLNVGGKSFFITPTGTCKIRLKIIADTGSKVYFDQIGFAAFDQTTVDFTPPQKPDITIGTVDHHCNTYDSATVFGYWDGQWDIKTSAWLDEPEAFPTLLATNIFNLIGTKEDKKIGQYSYKVINDSEKASIGYFKNADIKLNVEAGDILRIWAKFQPVGEGEFKRTVDNFAIAFSDGTTWNTRIHFGFNKDILEDEFDAKGLGRSSNYYEYGAVPDHGVWTPLDIDISSIHLEGRQISGLAFAMSGTYENMTVAPVNYDTVAVFVDFIDIHSSAGVKNYLPQIKIELDNKKKNFQDFSTLKTEDGLFQSGFMVKPVFDDEYFKTMASPQIVNEGAFTDKLALKVSSVLDNISYPRTGLTAEEMAGSSISLSNKLKFEWPSDSGQNKIDYNGGAVVIWTTTKKTDYSRDSLSEVNVGVEFIIENIKNDPMLTIAKYRAAQLSPESKRPPDFSILRGTNDLSYDEIFESAKLVKDHSLYKLTDKFETELTDQLAFKKNFIDAGRMFPENGEWTPIVIPVYALVPGDLNIPKEAVIIVKSLTIEAANCEICVDHIGATTVFKQFGDWQGNISPRHFVQDYSYLTDEEIHNSEQSIDGTESVKISSKNAGEKSFYLRLKSKEDPTPENPAGFNPEPYYLKIPETGGILSLNIFINTNEVVLPPEELMLEFHRAGDPDYTFYHRAYWGERNIVIGGVTSSNVKEHYYMGRMPSVSKNPRWVELFIPTETLDMNNSNFDGIRIRAHSKNAKGFEIWVDRLGMLGIVPHIGENKKHSVYAWNLYDYIFYSMQVKSWDVVLNASEYAVSKSVRTKDRTPPLIEAAMPARINYEGTDIKEPIGGGVYYVHKNADGTTDEVPLVFKKSDGVTLDRGKHIDLSITTVDSLDFSVVDSSRLSNNRVSIGAKKMFNGETVEIILNRPTVRDPLPSNEYCYSKWLTDIKGVGNTAETEVKLNDPLNQWAFDLKGKQYSPRYYYKNNENYIALQVVYDDAYNFITGGQTYIDVTPGPITSLRFYYPKSEVTIKASASAFISYDLMKDTIDPSRCPWVGVTAYSGTYEVVTGHKLKFKWSGTYKRNSRTYTMNATPESTLRRIQIEPGSFPNSFDPLRPYRTEVLPPPRPYFQIGGSEGLARNLLTYEQYEAFKNDLPYSTQEVEIMSLTGYNIDGHTHEIGIIPPLKRKNGELLTSGDAEAYFVTTTHAGDEFRVIVSTEDGKIETPYPAVFKVVPGGIGEVVIYQEKGGEKIPRGEDDTVEIDAENDNCTFTARAYDEFRLMKNYTTSKYKYYDSDENYKLAFEANDEQVTYEYISTNEISVNPLWEVESHEVKFNGDTYEITNAETVGAFLSKGRTSTNTFGAGWEHGVRKIKVVETNEIWISDPFDERVDAVVSYLGSPQLSSSAELRYKRKINQWDLDAVYTDAGGEDRNYFVYRTLTIQVNPLNKGFLSFREHYTDTLDEFGLKKQLPVQELSMNAVAGDEKVKNEEGLDVIDDALKFYVQTFNERNQLTNSDSISEVTVILDTTEDEFARLYSWPVTSLLDGKTRLDLKLEKGSAEVGLVAYNSRLKPKLRIKYNKKKKIDGTGYENKFDGDTFQAYKDYLSPDTRAVAIVNVYPNKLDTIFFDPDIAGTAESMFAIVKNRSLPIKAYGYDKRGNLITPVNYQTGKESLGGWLASDGEIKQQMQAANHLMTVYSAKGLSAIPGDVNRNIKNLPAPYENADGVVKLTVFASAPFEKLADSKRPPAVIINKDGIGYLKIVDFGRFDFPCIYQSLDIDKLDDNGEYDISFLYTADGAVTDAKIGVAYISEYGADVEDSDIQIIHSGKLPALGKFRFKFKGSASINSIKNAKEILVFLGREVASGSRPALRYDHVTIERVK